MTTLYPIGYQSQLVTMAELRRVHEPDMHPEFSRRIWPWLESCGGQMGIGGGKRPCPDPVSPASQACESFHQLQQYASGLHVYAAVDLVYRNPGHVHRAPTWAETESAEPYGLHTFIGKNTPTTSDDESWHLQCVEMRGFQTWVDRGRPDPLRYPIPTDPPTGGLITMERFALAGVDGNGYRLKDTRDGQGPKLTKQTQWGVTDPDAAGAEAVTINFTVTQPDDSGFLAVWGTGTNPGTSKLNFVKGQTIPNEVTLRLSNLGTFQVLPSVPLHLVADVVGYWFA